MSCDADRHSTDLEQEPPPQQVRDWNAEFQRVRDKIEKKHQRDFFDEKKFLREIPWGTGYNLGKDFSETATLYAKIIINEVFLPDHLKTFKGIDLGGVAGGVSITSSSFHIIIIPHHHHSTEDDSSSFRENLSCRIYSSNSHVSGSMICHRPSLLLVSIHMSSMMLNVYI